MAKRKPPVLSIEHHRVGPPVYTPEELSGLKDQALRLEKHIEILEEEVRAKKAELVGLRSLLG